MNPCLSCKALCCRYVVVPIDSPRSKNDFDGIKWYVAHNNVFVFQDHNNNWFVEFRTNCSFLKNNRCLIHPKNSNNKFSFTAPNVCLEHSNKECELHGNPYKLIFSSIEDVNNYLLKRWGKKNKQKKINAGGET